MERRMFTRPSSSGQSLAWITPKKISDDIGAAKLYVAVGEDVEDGKSNLVWAARNFLQAGHLKLVLLHVHRPAAHRIMAGSIRRGYRTFGKEETNTPLNQYLDFCRVSLKIQAETLVIEKSGPANGIIELIDRNHITSLVIGASSISLQRKAPSSQVASSVHLQAKQYCQIFYICNETLACTREATQLSARVESPQSCVSDQPEFPPSSETIADSVENKSATRWWLANTTSTSFSPFSQHTTGVPSGSSLSSTDGSLVPVSVASSKENHHSMVETDIQNEVFEQLHQVRNELERSRKEASERQQKTERDLLEASMMFKARENSLRKEKKEVEERLTREKTVLQKEHIHIRNKLQKANEQRAELENKLFQANSLKEELQREKDHVARQAAEMRQTNGNTILGSTVIVPLTEFSQQEIKEATDDFGNSKKIGQGGCGSVYKGFLRRTAVAIKKINRDGTEGQKEFNDEAKVLVFELLSNGSLEDYLQCKHQRETLSWRTRITIAADICTGLIFLHSNKPKGIVHGDLKPANVLLGTNLVCKLADFGMSRHLDHSNTTATAYHLTKQIKGTMGYMDPVYIASGELTAQYDVYSFGVVLLRLLTGKGPIHLVNKVESALRNDMLQDIIDTSAGEWPTEYAQELARLAVRCCRYDRKERPDLAKEAWGVLQGMLKFEESSREMPATNVFHRRKDTGGHEGTSRCCRWIC